MFIKNFKSLLRSAAALLPALAVAAMQTSAWAGPSGFSIGGCSADADTLGQAACFASESLPAIADLMYLLAIVSGCWFAIRAAILLRDHTDNPQQVRLSRPMMAMFVSGSLLGFSQFVNVFTDSIFSGASDLLTFNKSGGLTDAHDLSQMAVAFASSIPALKTITYYTGIVAGLFIILRAVYMMPQLEQGRAEPSKVIWTLISGVALFSLMPMIDMGLGTIGASATGGSCGGNVLTCDLMGRGGTAFEKPVLAVLSFIQLLGLIAFVRGCMILKMIGEHKDGAMGRALTHIFGGSAAMNITWTVKLLATTIGASWICSGTIQVVCGY